MSEAAKKECRLEFKVAKDKLAQRFSDAEKELEDEERRIQAQDSLSDILAAHEVRSIPEKILEKLKFVPKLARCMSRHSDVRAI